MTARPVGRHFRLVTPPPPPTHCHRIQGFPSGAPPLRMENCVSLDMFGETAPILQFFLMICHMHSRRSPPK
ncbi:hypothetical protein DPEC_G00020410 [Dallia pectoralis]|uniref:Uncharacterized protein n=1 Tax=Dallia pectoralis TaxID=75939 RepID=A0ACC2HG99_DALPE|nr:hypothetical protein DPEC_G00020410 [Dallia pectoralis]